MPSLDEALRRAEALAQNVKSPSIGWSASEVFQHCAQSIEFSMRGFPKLRSGIIRATVGPMVKRKFLRAGAMKHDLTGPIPGAPPLDATQSVEAALARLRNSVQAFHSHAGAFAPHFAYGPVGREEYEQLHAMHIFEHVAAFPPAEG